MTLDVLANFATTTVLTPPSPASTGLSLTVNTGTGALFPAAPFNVIVCPLGVLPTATNATVLRVTAVAGDVFTLQGSPREQDSSAVRSILAGDVLFHTPTAGTFAAIASAISAVTTTANNAATATGLANEITARAGADSTLTTAAAAAQTTANAAAVKANNLSDLANATTARTNLGLGTAATQASTAFDAAGAATAAQTAAATDATTKVATETTRATTAEALLAPKASPTFTGTVVLPSGQALIAPALGTPASGVATNLTGTAAGLTAGNVTTNANLTGVITSVGNATSVATQTGTGTKFVMDTSPALAGNPAVPTQAVGNNSTRIASTAFVAAGFNAKDGMVYNVLDHGLVGDDSTDNYAALTALIAAVPDGSRIFFPPVGALSYRLSAQVVINKHISLAGYTGRIGSGTVLGSVIRPTTSGAQAAMTSLIAIQNPYVIVEGLAFWGLDSTTSTGVLFSGGAGILSHGSYVDKCFIGGFSIGANFGIRADHITISQTQITGNNDAVFFANGNYFDFALVDCLLDGNTRSSLRLDANSTVVNVTVHRCHLGFSQYGILQDTTTTTDGFVGLTLLDSPIEQVTVQHIKAKNGGHWFFEGGYWLWVGTPANNAADIGPALAGPMKFNVRLESGTPNANAPAVLNVAAGSTFDVTAQMSLNGFAQAMYGGNYATHNFAEFTSSGTYTVPNGAKLVEVIAVAGGGGGNGGGAATTSGGVTTQVGGPGGAAGMTVRQMVTVLPGQTYAVVVGAGGTAGTGGAANNHPGGVGGAGGATTFIGNSITISAHGGGPGGQALGNSTTATGGGAWGAQGQTVVSGAQTAGCGGVATITVGRDGSDAGGLRGGGGGAGGPGGATLGGGGGTGGALYGGGPGGAAAASGTSTGVAGADATVNSGGGGGGGGGGAPGGAGGNGGAGGTGYLRVIVVA